MAIPADAVGDRLMLRDSIIHDRLDSGMAGQAVVFARQVQHGFMLPTVDAVAELAVLCLDRAVGILTFRHIFVAAQTELSS